MTDEERNILNDARKNFTKGVVSSKITANIYTLLGGLGFSWLLSKMFKLGQVNGAGQMGLKDVDMIEENLEAKESE